MRVSSELGLVGHILMVKCRNLPSACIGAQNNSGYTCERSFQKDSEIFSNCTAVLSCVVRE